MATTLDFPYSVGDEPNDEWTIEQVLHWCLLRSEHRVNERRDELIAALQEQLEEGKAEIMAAHEKAVAAAASDGPNEEDVKRPATVANKDAPNVGSVAGVENVDPAPPPVEAAKKTSASASTSAAAKKPSAVKTVTVEITDGPYAGETFVLRPKARAPCFIGRSTGKKFRERGISLPKDGEVSTTHGKVLLKAGKAYYVDTGSTNGTVADNEELGVDAPLELRDGLEMIIGAETLTITLGY